VNFEKIVTFLANRNYDIARCLLFVHALTFLMYAVAAFTKAEAADTLASVGLNLTALSLMNFALFGMCLAMATIYLYVKGGKQ